MTGTKVVATPVTTPDVGELNCRDARLILSAVPRDYGEDREDSPVMERAFTHWRKCEACQRLGLAQLTNKTITCEEVLFMYYEKERRAEYYQWNVSSLLEQLANEHLCGIYVVIPEDRHYDVFDHICEEAPCVGLRRYWQNVSRGRGFEEQEESARNRLFGFMLSTFQDQGWNLKPLFELQRRKVQHHVTRVKEGGSFSLAPHWFPDLQVNILQQEILRLNEKLRLS